MSKFITKFETQAAYEAAKDSLFKPNVSLIAETPNEVHYNPYVELVETRVVAKFDVTSTDSATQIAYSTGNFSSIEIDGVEQSSVTTGYTFSTTGEHTVKYTLTDPTSILNGAFYYCSDMTSCTIPDSVTSIGQYVFQGCGSLTNVTIPSGITSIGETTFSECRSLTSIDIPDNVTSIDSNAFNGCTSLTSIVIPSGVTSIGSNAFNGCRGLTSIVIPNSVTSIGSGMCKRCDSLTTCTIGSGVTSIGRDAFTECNSLTSVTVNAITPPTLSADIFSYSFQYIGYIYVPSASVDTYKAASGWSSFSSRIKSIP